MEKLFTPEEFLSVMNDHSTRLHENIDSTTDMLKDLLEGRIPSKTKECECPTHTLLFNIGKDAKAQLVFEQLIRQCTVTADHAQDAGLEEFWSTVRDIMANNVLIGYKLAKAHAENEKLEAMNHAQAR